MTLVPDESMYLDPCWFSLSVTASLGGREGGEPITPKVEVTLTRCIGSRVSPLPPISEDMGKVLMAFYPLARILGDCSTIHSPPALFVVVVVVVFSGD